MSPSILLLDCSMALEERVKRQGFDVASGNVGRMFGKMFLPGPVYEHEVIIYNPRIIAPDSRKIPAEEKSRLFPSKWTPLEDLLDKRNEETLLRLHRANEFAKQTRTDFAPLTDHVQRGAIVLVFINHISDDPTFLNAAYSWVPHMPEIAATQDFKPVSSAQYLEVYKGLDAKEEFANAITEVLPVLTVEHLRTPVRQKLIGKLVNASDFFPLLVNRQGDVLGFTLKLGDGRIITLPEYQDNEYVINTFLNRVLPRLYSQPIRRDIVDVFVSPTEEAAKQEIQTVESERQALDERLEKAKERLAFGERSKRKTIENDETAARVISYYKTATQQEDVALFYLYKVIEMIEHKFGSEKTAKDSLGKNAEWNIIGKLANASYGDVRHAPKPGETIKEWSREEIDECFAATERVLTAYFSTLFEQS